jgi:hypothetical protein
MRVIEQCLKFSIKLNILLEISVRRVVEYCQWSEMEHSRQKVVGKEPDFCVNTGIKMFIDCAYEKKCVIL